MTGSTLAARKMSRVLITGAAGFIGGHLEERLRAEGVAVLAVDDLRVVPLVEPAAHLMRKSVLDLTVADLVGVDTVYHLASEKSVPLSFSRPLRYVENLQSTTHLLGLCAQVGVSRVIVASSCEVYGKAGRIPTDEAQPLAPLSPYAASKVAMEMVTRAHQQAPDSAMSALIVRFFNVYGPRERPDAVIPRFCLSALTDGLLPIEGTGAQRRDFSYIDDVVDDLVRLAAGPAEVPVLNLGSGTSASVLEVSEIVRDLSPGMSVVRPGPRQNEIPEFRADTALNRRVLRRATPRVGLREGIERTLRWWIDSNALDRAFLSAAVTS